jgi:dihydrolipoamide dehydrogenase
MTKLIVVGGGPAGITAALEAAARGAQVTLVSAEAIGGRANWHSLVPSKVYLTAADHLGESHHYPDLGLRGASPEPDLAALRSRIADQARAWSGHHEHQLRQHGVTVIAGKASFVDSQYIRVDREGAAMQTLAFDRAVIATGSEPIFLPQIKPDGNRILAPRLAGKLAEWPRHMIIIGGGVTGAEFTYFFNRMGYPVTWVTDLAILLPRTDRDLSDALEQALQARGVTILKSAPVQSVMAEDDGVVATLKDGRSLAGSHAFIAMGRRPDTAGLNLEAASIAYTAQGIHVDAFCQTSQPHIYAAGDVAGAPYIANRGQAQARVAARHALGVATPPFRAEAIIEAIYTSPQLAQLGLTEFEAAHQGHTVKVYRAEYGDALKPRLSGDAMGFIKLLVDPQEGRILGGAALGERAAEVLGAIAVAMVGGVKIDTLATLFPAYPTLTELVGIAVRGY